ncbi:thioredoxin family protein [Kaarinaea lacus]
MSQQRLNALLLTAPGCVHCNALKNILEKLLADRLLGQLDVIDVTSRPEIAQQYGIKSVPWLKLGPFEFSGAQREQELRGWITQLDSAEGIAAYLKQLLETDDLDLAIKLVRENPGWINSLFVLVADEDKDIKLQLGISAIFEEFEGSSLLRDNIDRLGELVTHPNPKIRADIAHFLALSHDDRATGFLQQLALDSDREVKEIATDALRAS